MSKWRLPMLITRHVLFALVVGSVGGMLFILFLIRFDHFTSTREFCTTCHSMTFASEFYERSPTSIRRPASGPAAATAMSPRGCSPPPGTT